MICDNSDFETQCRYLFKFEVQGFSDQSRMQLLEFEKAASQYCHTCALSFIFVLAVWGICAVRGKEGGWGEAYENGVHCTFSRFFGVVVLGVLIHIVFKRRINGIFSTFKWTSVTPPLFQPFPSNLVRLPYVCPLILCLHAQFTTRFHWPTEAHNDVMLS